LIKLNKSV